jgi:hypothetical protein
MTLRTLYRICRYQSEAIFWYSGTNESGYLACAACDVPKGLQWKLTNEKEKKEAASSVLSTVGVEGREQSVENLATLAHGCQA